jgi:hypothetical protein
MKFVWILAIYLLNYVARSNAMTRAQQLCRLQARSDSSNSNQQTTETSTIEQRTVNPITENLQPFGSGLFRKKRFMPMVPQYTGSTTPAPDLVRNRSTCPWVMVMDYNPTRFPRRMERAVCQHNNGDNRCDISFLNGNMNGMSLLVRLLELETECALVYTKMNFLRECCENGNYTTRLEVVDWPVACTCSRKRMMRVTAVNNGR